MKSFAAILFLAICLTAANTADVIQPKLPKQTAEPQVINDTVSGVYRITGEGVNGKRYSGIATVKKPVATQLYVINQMVGGELTAGVAILVDKTLVISWKQGEALGITRLDFTGRDANARWVTLPGNGQFNQETWAFLASNEDE